MADIVVLLLLAHRQEDLLNVGRSRPHLVLLVVVGEAVGVSRVDGAPAPQIEGREAGRAVRGRRVCGRVRVVVLGRGRV